MDIQIIPSVTHLETQLRKVMDTLAQRDLIERSDADQWIGYMVNVMPQDALWHMIRAGGFGGSEIGGLVRNFLGVRADHDFTAHDCVMGKLLKQTPTPSLDVMARGHAMEPIHASRFYSEYNTARDIAAYEKLKHAQGNLQWMRYSPDDMVYLSRPTAFSQAGEGIIELQGRLLLDYKSPTTVAENSTIAFQYSSQLHQGAILCQEQGIDIAGAMLSQFNWATWSLKNDYVPINPELCDLIKEAGTFYWNEHVMRASVPRYVTRKRMELNDQKKEQWTEVAMQLAQFNSIKTAVEKKSTELREKLLAGLQLTEHRLDGQVLMFPGALKISSSSSIDEKKICDAFSDEEVQALRVKEEKTKYDHDLILNYLRENKIDLKQFKIKTAIDPSLAFAFLESKDVDPDKFMSDSLRFAVLPEVKKQTEDWLADSFEDVSIPHIEDPVQEALTPPASPEIEQTAIRAHNFRPKN
jgi:hypothetical protein